MCIVHISKFTLIKCLRECNANFVLPQLNSICLLNILARTSQSHLLWKVQKILLTDKNLLEINQAKKLHSARYQLQEENFWSWGCEILILHNLSIELRDFSSLYGGEILNFKGFKVFPVNMEGDGGEERQLLVDRWARIFIIDCVWFFLFSTSKINLVTQRWW